MNIPAIVNIWFVDTRMENNIVMIIRWDKFLNVQDLLQQHAALSLTLRIRMTVIEPAML